MAWSKQQQQLRDLATENRRLGERITGTELAQQNKQLKHKISDLENQNSQLRQAAAKPKTGGTRRQAT